ncbi:MAG: ribosome recycling factor [Eubacteriales bacterium]
MEKMDKTISVLTEELAHIRAGRANPQLLDNIKVDCYGSMMPINQVGNISAPEPRMLIVSVWDTNLIPEVEKAIMKSDLGINPANDGKVIRLVMPELTEERRKDLVKVIKTFSEEAKIALRSIRRDAIDHFKKDEKASVITEDDLKDLEKEIQETTDEHVKTIDKMMKDKESEIMAV